MKNLMLIALFLFGVTFASNASATLEIATPFQNTAANMMDNSTSTIDSGVETAEDADANSKKKKKRKKAFRDRSLIAKILIVIGTAIFVVLCVLFGTVSIG